MKTYNFACVHVYNSFWTDACLRVNVFIYATAVHVYLHLSYTVFLLGNHNDIQFSLRVLPLNIKILLQYWLCVHSQDLIEGFILNAYRWPVLKFTYTFVWISLRCRLTDCFLTNCNRLLSIDRLISDHWIIFIDCSGPAIRLFNYIFS